MKKLIPLMAVAVFAVDFAPSVAQAQFTEVEAGTVYSATVDQAVANACAAGTTFSQKLLTIKAIKLGGPKNAAITANVVASKVYWLETNDTAATCLWMTYTPGTLGYIPTEVVNIKTPPSGVRFKTNDTTAGGKPTLYLYTAKD